MQIKPYQVSCAEPAQATLKEQLTSLISDRGEEPAEY
jgi:hypothetical protein